METFISYSSSNKSTAGKTKNYLDQFGFNCFLAHEDIPLQTVWPKEIFAAIKRCDLLVLFRFVWVIRSPFTPPLPQDIVPSTS